MIICFLGRHNANIQRLFVNLRLRGFMPGSFAFAKFHA